MIGIFLVWTCNHLQWISITVFIKIFTHISGLENSTRPLVFTSASGCRASEILIFVNENYYFSHIFNNFCDAGQVSILRNFEA